MKMSLVEMRKNAKLTQREVAYRMGVVPKTIRNWERCTTRLQIPQFIILCKLYCCTVDDIFLSYS